MRTLWKIVASILAWVILTLMAAAGLEIAYGEPRPGFVQPIVLPVLVLLLFWIWRRRQPATRH
jgi:hypothetical protein